MPLAIAGFDDKPVDLGEPPSDDYETEYEICVPCVLGKLALGGLVAFGLIKLLSKNQSESDETE